LEALGQQRRVLAWDAPGYGQSSNVVDAEPVAPAYAQALSSLLDNQNIERCVVVGHSLGAIMGAAFAAKHPDRVAGLFLLSPAAGYGSASEAVRESKREARLTMIRTLGPLGMAAARSANMLSENADSGARAWVQRSMSMVHVRGYTQATYLLANADLLRDVTAYGGRIGVVAGADDTITPPSGCAVVARAAGVALQVVPATGHAGYVEAPDVFSALIRDFCEVCEHANQSRTT
jgi:pimeloyl-ACP methyl ester carboxylesterase